MKNNDYINIQGWMVSELKLNGNELILFAIIHGYSKDGINEYRGSKSYISTFMSVSERTVVNLIKKLELKGFIFKTLNSTGNLYKAITEISEKIAPVQKLHYGSAKVAQVSSAKVAHNNNNNNNKVIINKNSKILFSESEFNNIEKVRSKLLENKKNIEKYKGVDLDFYIDSVLNWSDSSDTKRTNKGWIATIKTFMNKDIVANKLTLKLKNKSNKKVTFQQARKNGGHYNF